MSNLRAAVSSATHQTRIGIAVVADTKPAYDVRFISGEQEIATALRKHGADHPVHEFDFTLARLSFRTSEKLVALIVGPEGVSLAAVPVVRYDHELVILNNYILLPEDAMAALLTALKDRFRPNNIRTQRNYNNYSIFPTKTPYPDDYQARFDAGFEAYLNSLGQKTRFNLRYYEKRLRASFPSVETQFVAPGNLRREYFAEFIELVGKRYNKSFWTGFLPDQVFAKFRDCVTCTIVRIERKIAAVNIFFVSGDTLVFHGNTFDETYSKFSLGFLTTFWSFRHACECGFSKVILGPGDFGYKSRLSNAKETVYVYSLL
jgi:Acetyltransferase (GNAT) domain